MKTYWTLMRNEVKTSWLVLLVALLAGCLPLLAPLLPGTERYAPQDVSAVVALFFVFGLGGVLVLGLGSSFLGRDLAERRLGFYFVRPIPGLTLWAAKLSAAYLVVLAALLLLVLPTAILGSLTQPRTTMRLDDWQTLGWFLLGVLALLAASHALSVMVRSRSILLLGDLVALVLVLACGWLGTEQLWRERALQPLEFAGSFLAVLGTLVLLVAGAVQTVRGRNDLARSHRVLSTVLWPGLLALGLGFVTFAQWVVSPKTASMTGFFGWGVAPQGPWLAVSGEVAHRAGYRGVFLVNGDTGESDHLGGVHVVSRWPSFSADGRTAVWSDCRPTWPPGGEDFRCEVWQRDLASDASPHPTGIELGSLSRLALAPDGSRVAAYDSPNLLVYELATGRQLAAVLMRQRPEFLEFQDRDRLRFLHVVGQQKSLDLELWQFDLTSHELRHQGLLPPRALPAYLALPANHSDSWPMLPEKIAREWRPQPLGDHLTVHPGDYWWFGNPLQAMSGGRLVAGWYAAQGNHLAVLSATGEVEHWLDLPGQAGDFYFGGEPIPGRLAVGLRSSTAKASLPSAFAPERPLADWSTWLLDVERGQLEFLAAGVVPLAGVRSAAGSPGARLFRSRDALLRWDPASRSIRQVLSLEPSSQDNGYPGMSQRWW